MKTYTTKAGQNIYDVCLELYGSIEGLLDLLISNSSLDVEKYGPQELRGTPLSLDTTLQRGIILKYHEGIVINPDIQDFLKDNNIKIAHGEHIVPLFDNVRDKVKAIIVHSGLLSDIGIELSSGSITIDWGDFSEPTIINDTEQHGIEHAYNTSDKHIITLYGDFECVNLDFSDVGGTVYPTSRIKTRKFKTNNATPSLMELIEITPD